MTPFVREMVRQRAGDRCQYCRIPQYAIPDVRFHVEHVVAVQHGGGDDPENLALACDRCNYYKGTEPRRVQLRITLRLDLTLD